MTESCLVAKLKHYVELTPAEAEFLEKAEAEPQKLSRRSNLASSGQKLPAIYVLKTGWLLAHTNEEDGMDMVAEIYHPGDLVGVSQLGCEFSTLNYVAATDAELCALPKGSLPEMFVAFPRLIGLFFGFASVERASLIDRLRAMGRMSARDCVALFLLQTHARLCLTGAVDDDSFSLPLSQETIGNAVGLSTVSVNRAIRLLESEGHLVREQRRLRLAQRELLAREVDFVDRVYRMDNSWLPAGATSARDPS